MIWVKESGRFAVCPSSFVVPEVQYDLELPETLPVKMAVLIQSLFIEKCITRLCLLLWQ